jgi:hypothetical protein
VTMREDETFGIVVSEEVADVPELKIDADDDTSEPIPHGPFAQGE